MKHRHTQAHRFALSAVALAAACLWSSQALALGLGRLNVQSVLGETLRAEIDVTSITPEEASSLRLRVAPPEAYRAAGVEYNPALAGAQVSLERRGDGRAFLRVIGDRAVLEPFVDVIVEATWSSGRLVREYTMLFDPPATRVATPAPVTSPVASTAPVAAPAPAPAPAAVAAAPAPRAPAPARPAAGVQAPAPAAMTSGDEVRVRRGDSLSAIASRVPRQGVSLDQMLVALFRGNSQAFIGDNMNRLKAGAVLQVPSVDDARKVSAAEARQVIQAQAADFTGYRQRLASGAPATGDAPPARTAAGKVQAQVDDRKAAAAPSPDKLTLSKGGLKPGAPETKVSKDSERKDDRARLAELSRNVEELKRLQQGAPAPAVPPGKAAAPAAPAPAPAAAPTPSPAPAPVPAPVAQAPAPAPAAAPAAPVAPPPPAPAPVAAAPTPAPAPAPAPAPEPPPAPAPKPAPAKAELPAEPGFFASLMESPLLIPGAAVLVALLAGFGVYRLRGNMRKKAGETSFLESRLQPDSFFGASGGQRVDTKDGGSSSAAGTSSVSSSYSLSQLDAIGDVDPVAEADVYLAYGRDLQAEEILKEAMRATPDRLAIRLKLLEVYAKRRDAKGFELLATQVHSASGGQGEDWAKAQAMGRELEPDNPLYQPGGAPSPVLDDSGRAVEVLDATTRPHTAAPDPAAFVPAADATSLDGGLDLELDLDVAAPPPSPGETTQPLRTDVDFAAPGLAFDGGDQKTIPVPQAKPPAAAPAAAIESLDFDLGDFEAPKTVAQPIPKTIAHSRSTADVPRTVSDIPTTRGEPRIAPSAEIPGDDFGSFTLPASALEPMDSGDPLVRKLELAEEFRQIGDVEGARDLLEEVVAKADGALKAKAQGMLNGLG